LRTPPNRELNESGYHLVPMDNFLLVADESDFGEVRSIPPRIVEGYLPGDENDDDDDSIDFGDDEDDEVVEEEDDDNPPSRDWSKFKMRTKKNRRDSGQEDPSEDA
jgi:hypothetical protein